MWRRGWFWLAVGLALVVVAAGVIALQETGQTAAGETPSSASATEAPSVAASTSLTPAATQTQPADPPVKAPAVVGLTYPQTKTAFQKAVNDAPHGAHLRLSVTKRYSTKFAGKVIAVKPAAYGHPGTKIPSGTTVHLILGRALPRVPSVVNEGAERAARDLKNRGYDVRTRRQESSEKEGLVLSQSIAPGTPLIPGRKTIVLTVARPPSGYYVQVTGSGSALVTWGTVGGTHQQTVALPFSAKVGTGSSFDVISLVAQRQSGDSGSIACEILWSGHIQKRSVSSGAYAVCSANAST